MKSIEVELPCENGVRSLFLVSKTLATLIEEKIRADALASALLSSKNLRSGCGDWIARLHFV
ncbi:MAG: hypothetical protein UX06_C0040G0005 [Candidatus Giovannonibacteria bacterium GW2011_GWA2_45_21]|uniref:Uncharacterized protein n=1 Tax=Candidatus Giovannonibacteria bacterium GW2011_GWA2_45_21 TaxID=1618649 RepID=A0A0G1Q4I1_9BACT|nr:MAG: hypothetical protein UX06_C0040G0005 [Candidatus Giovannonibacteria bacterium GW2011_GWA2_45_21]